MAKIQKKEKKSPKNKKNQPLKVVYITNPIKFKASASEFRALVQELTGQDAVDTAYSTTSFSTEDGGGEAVKATEEDGIVHAVLEEEEVTKLERPSDKVVELEEFDPMAVSPTVVGSYEDSFVSSLMMEGFHELGPNLVDVLRSLDAM